ncbi:tyrosine-type recombinase/integrase [Leucobacter sp. UT-8R-CII-1-4]|uniref:tyrosine-type recombinase/integrase n=1 Tax=Leucobacter sp. UT-8R-CII-1-4 TaxID=3040075 RepID=UPI0024A8FB15|nr:tyrosine-type recombinase/integrase [Leucobacter sp. UT-8R-CII-1-4]MDI6024062.1 tyrosine-type recombinase/integrase [Leucobacter sp. UT-8R-CII-1-4]
MGRPRTPIGTFGVIATRAQPRGNYVSKARYRDWDGKNRLVQTTGPSRSAAERNLKQKLAERTLYQPGFNGMSADSPFSELVAYWLEDIKIEDRLSRTTRNLYERDMRTLVLPAFKDLTLREIGVARCDYFLKHLAKRSYSRAKHARVVLRLALALAVRHEILPRNPMDHVSRLHRKKTIPDAFTIGEVQDIRAAIKAWESRRILAGPRPDRQLGQIVEVLLGTSARIGEVLAIRLQDLDLEGPIPTARIAGTIVSRKGESTHRQDHPKTDRSVRRVALPSFALHAIRTRLLRTGETDPDALLFGTRARTPHTTNNIRRLLREVTDDTGIENVTPHRFRRTVATVVNDAQGALLASELLGHTDPRITMQHYIQHKETVNPVTAAHLEQAFGKAG